MLEGELRRRPSGFGLHVSDGGSMPAAEGVDGATGAEQQGMEREAWQQERQQLHLAAEEAAVRVQEATQYADEAEAKVAQVVSRHSVKGKRSCGD